MSHSSKTYFFLSGIARSGSTVLGSILNQNPDIHVTPTSPLLDLYCLTETTLQNLTEQYTYDVNTVGPNIHKELHHSFYNNIDKPIIIDKHRGWPRNINTIKQIITPEPKVIATYRPIAENIVSFLKLINNDPANFIDKELRKLGKLINTQNRAMMLWQHYSSDPFYSLQHGLQHNRKHILVVDYENIVKKPAETIENIYNFLEIPSFKHDFNTINNTCSENDKNWGLKDLHTIKPTLVKTSDDPLTILGPELFDYFNKIDLELTKYI